MSFDTIFDLTAGVYFDFYNSSRFSRYKIRFFFSPLSLLYFRTRIYTDQPEAMYSVHATWQRESGDSNITNGTKTHLGVDKSKWHPWCSFFFFWLYYLSTKKFVLLWVYMFIRIIIHSSWEIEDFVETHLSKLWVILRSRVLRVVCPH